VGLNPKPLAFPADPKLKNFKLPLETEPIEAIQLSFTKTCQREFSLIVASPAARPIKTPLEPADRIKTEPFLGTFSTIFTIENSFIEYKGSAHPKILSYAPKSSNNSGAPEYITSSLHKLAETII
jgi:hypothetical protein